MEKNHNKRHRILIADDESDARSLLIEYLSEEPNIEIVAEAKNGEEAVLYIDRFEPDIVFLDIQMPGKSGFQVLQHIVHVPQIVFTTAFDRYALRAFEHNAIDYLLKPYTKERFQRALNKILQSGRPSFESVHSLNEVMQGTNYPERFLVDQGTRFVGVSVSDIVWIEAEGDYVKLYTVKQSYLSSLGIGEMEQKLNPQQFQRIHRSAIVNMSQIVEVIREPSGPQVKLTTGQIQKVSRTYLPAFKKWMV